MRTYSGFLLFEEVLDFAPQTDTVLYKFVQDVIRPRVRILMEDCFTTVGKLIDVKYEIEGLIELSTGLAITKARVDALLAAGTYTVPVRNLYTCVVGAGICRKCYAGTYIDIVTPALGTYLRLEPEYNYKSNVVKGNGTITTFTLSEDPANYTKALVIINGVIQTSGYTISGTTITMTVAPALGVNVVVKFYKITAQPFVGFLAETFTGSLLGMKPLSTQMINIRPSLGQTLFTDQELNLVRQQLRNNYKVITDSYLTYIDTIKDSLEKAIYMAMLYGLYSNVTI